jgi:hypothetical protein
MRKPAIPRLFVCCLAALLVGACGMQNPFADRPKWSLFDASEKPAPVDDETEQPVVAN